jgi:hypothetical protein
MHFDIILTVVRFEVLTAVTVTSEETTVFILTIISQHLNVTCMSAQVCKCSLPSVLQCSCPLQVRDAHVWTIFFILLDFVLFEKESLSSQLHLAALHKF